MKKHFAVFIVALIGSILGTGIYNRFNDNNTVQAGKSSIVASAAAVKSLG